MGDEVAKFFSLVLFLESECCCCCVRMEYSSISIIRWQILSGWPINSHDVFTNNLYIFNYTSERKASGLTVDSSLHFRNIYKRVKNPQSLQTTVYFLLAGFSLEVFQLPAATLKASLWSREALAFLTLAISLFMNWL